MAQPSRPHPRPVELERELLQLLISIGLAEPERQILLAAFLAPEPATEQLQPALELETRACGRPDRASRPGEVREVAGAAVVRTRDPDAGVHGAVSPRIGTVQTELHAVDWQELPEAQLQHLRR